MMPFVSLYSLSFLLLCLWIETPFVRGFAVISATSSTSRTSSSSLQLSSSSFTSEEARAWEVFQKFDEHDTGSMSLSSLGDMLQMLDIEAAPDEQRALFKFLDSDGDNAVDFSNEFLPWYNTVVAESRETAQTFQALLRGRRTVDHFDQTPVSPQVVRRAIECAIAAPNRSGSEPWRFIQVGKETVQKLQQLKQDTELSMETKEGMVSTVDWAQIPGWLVVTTKLSPDKDVELDDFKSTSCAVQNLMLSLWVEGIGSKWTSGPVQKTKAFAKLVGVDTTQERVAGCIWFGFATGGLVNADPKRRKKTVDDVLTELP